MATATSMGKDEILEAISNMTVLELSELVEAFKTKFNVTVSAAPVGAAAQRIQVRRTRTQRECKKRLTGVRIPIRR